MHHSKTSTLMSSLFFVAALAVAGCTKNSGQPHSTSKSEAGTRDAPQGADCQLVELGFNYPPPYSVDFSAHHAGEAPNRQVTNTLKGVIDGSLNLTVSHTPINAQVRQVGITLERDKSAQAAGASDFYVSSSTTAEFLYLDFKFKKATEHKSKTYRVTCRQVGYDF